MGLKREPHCGGEGRVCGFTLLCQKHADTKYGEGTDEALCKLVPYRFNPTGEVLSRNLATGVIDSLNG